MALDINGGGLFNRGASSEARAGTVIVAKDGSGDTDDVHEALALLPSSGGHIIIKEGIYDLGTNYLDITKPNVSISGFGSATVLMTSSSPGAIIYVNADFCRLTNFMLSGSSGGSSIYVNGDDVVEHHVFKDLIITGSGGNGITIYHSRYVVVEDCYIYSCSLSAVRLDVAHYSIIKNNNLSSNSRHGIHADTSSSCVVSGNVIVDNNVSNTQAFDGIFLTQCDRCAITGNVCLNNDRYEINISDSYCDNNVVSGNNCNGSDHVGSINDAGSNTLPNGAVGTNNLALDDLNYL